MLFQKVFIKIAALEMDLLFSTNLISESATTGSKPKPKWYVMEKEEVQKQINQRLKNAIDAVIKQQIAEQVIDRLEKRWPGFAEQVEVIDVATPVTWERFTGNWKASFEGWMLNKQTIRYAFGKGLKKTLPGLDNFYMIGQWTQPGGGLPPAATMGRDIIKRLCKRDRKKFQIK